MSIQNSKHLLHSSVAVVSLMLFFGTGLAAAEAPAPFGIGQSSMLRRLAAGPEDLVFRGEAARRRFSVSLSRGELDQTRTFQLGLKNTVALLPERSSLRLIVNGHPMAAVPVQSPNALSIIPVAIPTGTLVAGANTIDIEVAMAHRVDCSVSATYELWTALDPAQTGFVVPASADGSVRSVEDIAGEALALDGTSRIHLQTADSPDAAALTRAGRFIDALVRRAGLGRPVVEAGPGQGSGPGIDVALISDRAKDATSDLRVVGREDGLTFARNAAGRLVLIMSSLGEADLDAQVAAFAGKTAVAPRSTGQVRIEGETQLSFADLGLPSVNFTGRHYTAALDMTLPADFYPANYGKARLLIDGAHATDLEPGSELVFRVNGRLASSLRLGPDRGGMLRDEAVELPLRLFQPGRNEIAIEGVMPKPSDRECAPTNAPATPRLSLSDASRLEFPAFAHLATSPQISGTWARSPATPAGMNVYLPGADALSIGSALTVLANMAGEAGPPAGLAIHLGAPTAADAPGLVVAPWSALPASLSAPLQARLTGAAMAEPARPGLAERTAVAIANKASLLRPILGRWFPPSSVDPRPLIERAEQLLPNRSPIDPQAVLAGLERLLHDQTYVDGQALLDRGRHLLEAQGYAFSADDGMATVPFTAHTLLVAAVDPSPRENRIAGIEVPRLVENPAQWLVVTAQEPAVLEAGLDRMTSDRHWRDMQGDLVSLDIDKGTFSSAQPSRLIYIRPERLALAEIRPILGGLVSNNIELSLAVIALLMTLLGVSTHVLVRRTGAK